ncbi:MAG: spore germination protein [Tumebacillaceae bacterium]
MKRIRKIKGKYQKSIEQLEQPSSERVDAKLTPDLDQNEAMLKQEFRNCSDLVFRKVRTKQQASRLLVVYVDGMVDTKHLDEVILKPLLYEGLPQGLETVQDLEQLVEEQMIPVGQVQAVGKIADVVQKVLAGNVAIVAEGVDRALLASVEGGEKRSLQEPVGESVIRGPREGFTESIRTNTSLIRRKIKSARLKMETVTLGELTQTGVVFAYLEGLATEELVSEVRERLQRIKIDGVLESGYVEEFLEDNPYSPFPQMQYTERPDVAVGNLLEGRVVVLVEGTPIALVVPITFWGTMQANEDYYERWMMASAMRWVRMAFLLIALLLPSLYVAITTYDQEMLPTNLLLSIASARENSPFPALIEALIMEVTFEALREAGVRLPKPVGQAVSIVGALVIGQAAVEAEIVSAPLVIVVSITGIASFTIPRYNMAIGIRLLRFPMILLAGTLGLYGIALGMLGILLHLASMRSFGVPFLYPVAPLTLPNLKDVFLRAPWWMMNLRPRLTGFLDPVRVAKGQKPGPSRGKQDEDTQK